MGYERRFLEDSAACRVCATDTFRYFVTAVDGDAPRTVRRVDVARAPTRTPRTIPRWAVAIALVTCASARGVSPFTTVGFAVMVARLGLGSTCADAPGLRISRYVSAPTIVFRTVASLVAVAGALVVARVRDRHSGGCFFYVALTRRDLFQDRMLESSCSPL